MVAVFGGAPIRDQAARLKDAQVVVGTVGRVMDMIGRHHLFLDQARYVVLDEADEMLDLGFLEDVEEILRRAPMGRQTALFSATVPTPIRRLADTFMHDPVEIQVRAATLTIDTVDQFYVEVPDREKPDALVNVLERERPDQAIVFVRTKIGVDRLARRLGDAGVRVKTLHGDMTQGQRDGVMIAFKGGRERLLVATDVAARGLDLTGRSSAATSRGSSGTRRSRLSLGRRATASRPAGSLGPSRARCAARGIPSRTAATACLTPSSWSAPAARKASSPRTWWVRWWITRIWRTTTCATCGCSSASASSRCRPRGRRRLRSR